MGGCPTGDPRVKGLAQIVCRHHAGELLSFDRETFRDRRSDADPSRRDVCGGGSRIGAQAGPGCFALKSDSTESSHSLRQERTLVDRRRVVSAPNSIAIGKFFWPILVASSRVHQIPHTLTSSHLPNGAHLTPFDGGLRHVAAPHHGKED
jgi:hypothetical protein